MKAENLHQHNNTNSVNIFIMRYLWQKTGIQSDKLSKHLPSMFHINSHYKEHF